MKSFKRACLSGISPRTWEHPADKAALSALRSITGFDKALETILGFTSEKSIRLAHLASCIRVSERQMPKVHSLLKEACNILDYNEIPELFVAESPILNAGAVGFKKPFIVLNSSLVNSLTDEELLCIIGHELGHCISGHALYATMLTILIQVSQSVSGIPLTGIALQAVIAALREWQRKSELSADRAGLLVVQDPEISYKLLIRLSGGKDLNSVDINEFFIQAAEYQNTENFSDSVFKFLNTIGATHPFPVIRLTELKTWVDNGSLGRVLGGYYDKSSEGKAKVTEDFKDAANSYRSDFQKTGDTVENVYKKVVDNAQKAKETIENFFKK